MRVIDGRDPVPPAFITVEFTDKEVGWLLRFFKGDLSNTPSTRRLVSLFEAAGYKATI